MKGLGSSGSKHTKEVLLECRRRLERAGSQAQASARAWGRARELERSRTDELGARMKTRVLEISEMLDGATRIAEGVLRGRGLWEDATVTECEEGECGDELVWAMAETGEICDMLLQGEGKGGDVGEVVKRIDWVLKRLGEEEGDEETRGIEEDGQVGMIERYDDLRQSVKRVEGTGGDGV